jgi:hypothetical protein
MRLCIANGTDTTTFARIAFDADPIFWSRDIDRQIPTHVIKKLHEKTGIPIEDIIDHTFAAYVGTILEPFKHFGPLDGIIPIINYRHGDPKQGTRFCPSCLREDRTPYFRLYWRLTVNTHCPFHRSEYSDACPNCNYRVELHHTKIKLPPRMNKELVDCYNCGFDLRKLK